MEQRALWLELARTGRNFLVGHAYAGNGRWFYQLDRLGRMKRGTISVFTDLFVLAGLCEYAMAARDDQDVELIRRTYTVLERNVHDPEFKDIFHGTWSPRFKRHGLYMITLPTAALAGEILGHDRVRPLVDHCLEQILHVFAKDDRRMLFESVGATAK